MEVSAEMSTLRLGRHYQGVFLHQLYRNERHVAPLLLCQSLHVVVGDDTIHQLLLQVPLHPMQCLLASPGIQEPPRLHHPSELGHLERTNGNGHCRPYAALARDSPTHQPIDQSYSWKKSQAKQASKQMKRDIDQNLPASLRHRVGTIWSALVVRAFPAFQDKGSNQPRPRVGAQGNRGSTS